MATVAGVPETTVASLALWVGGFVAVGHRLVGPRGPGRVGRALTATLHLLAAGAFAVALGAGAVAASSLPGFLLLVSVGFVCGHEALVSRLSERLWHREWVRSPGRVVRVLWFLLLLLTGVSSTNSSSNDEADGNPFLPPRESRVRRLAFGVLAVLALSGATLLLG